MTTTFANSIVALTLLALSNDIGIEMTAKNSKIKAKSTSRDRKVNVPSSLICVGKYATSVSIAIINAAEVVHDNASNNS
jgi:hypothetical protein